MFKSSDDEFMPVPQLVETKSVVLGRDTASTVLLILQDMDQLRHVIEHEKRKKLF